ncbi:MAG: hypothetical protein BWY99_02554 [Synergistetes bacterium ADurb.BinA166]|nr:MAG: hypothetical protein BWY99_02554 [Synergistetes bacterium ADurb.BinA166]
MSASTILPIRYLAAASISGGYDTTDIRGRTPCDFVRADSAPGFSPLGRSMERGRNVARPERISLRCVIALLAAFSSVTMMFSAAPPTAAERAGM